ncbi:MAG TPA: glycosyltransferase [Patescibacteria group bacterium]|nr:glycosyltransferase [Patescibacteria group bacterium]
MLGSKPTIVFLSTYPPRECGIATFTQDLFNYCKKTLGSSYRCKVAAFNFSHLDTYKYPVEVEWEIDQNSKKDYLRLAKIVNEDTNISGVIIQHEYGIFGGIDGEKILYFMQHCKKPMLVTLHTALPKPRLHMQQVTEKIIDFADNVVVLTKSSKKIIETVYPNSNGKIFIIPHGIHPVMFSSQKEYKAKLELKNRIVLSTFGLLSRGKGIEYALAALPDVIKKYPTVLYLILGETHPVIRRQEGEKYRLELAHLVRILGLEKHVKFYDQYLSLHDLLEFLQATDIYISTSINPNQAVSGTLSYALGAGRAVISTEFAQAKEVITPDMGKLVPIQDSAAITSALLDLLGDEKKLEQMARNAYEKTRPMLWSDVAQKYTNLLTRTIIPPVNLKHLYSMTDDFGLFQFAAHSIPNKDFGYTLDDNARALIFCSWLLRKKFNKKVYDLIKIYFAFLKKCQLPNGSFINYIGFSDKLSTCQNNKEDLSDTHARAMWALSEIMNNNILSSETRTEAKRMYLLSLEKGAKLGHIRSKAIAIKSFILALDRLPEQKTILLGYINDYANSLVDILKDNSVKSWIWFEKELNYNNAILSESLLLAGNCLNNSNFKEKGILSLQFLIGKTFSSEMYMPIGHSGWYTNHEKRSQYDQQPEDPASTILALFCAYKNTHNEEYRNLAHKCFSWFLGNNSLNKPLYDEKSGGCFDGLHPDRVNLNQGAESLVSYLISNYTISEFH